MLKLIIMLSFLLNQPLQQNYVINECNNYLVTESFIYQHCDLKDRKCCAGDSCQNLTEDQINDYKETLETAALCRKYLDNFINF